MFSISVQVTASGSIPSYESWIPWFADDYDKLIADFKMRIKAYRKALFQNKVINLSNHFRPKFFYQKRLQSITWKGKKANV